MKIIGYYHAYGYRIEDNLDGEMLYEAGNSFYDSTSVIDKDQGLNIKTIKKYCERTGKEIAEEKSGEWLGAYQDENVDEDVEHILESNKPFTSHV